MMRKRERQREKETERDRDRQTEREKVKGRLQISDRQTKSFYSSLFRDIKNTYTLLCKKILSLKCIYITNRGITTNIKYMRIAYT